MPAPSAEFLKAHPTERALPAHGLVHLAFVGQINLEEIQPFDVDAQLPTSGLLSFFYNPQVFASDTDPHAESGIKNNLTGYSYNWFGYDNLGNWQVIYTDTASSTLQRAEFPSTLYEEITYKPQRLSFRVETCLPSIETCFFPAPESDEGVVKLTRKEWQSYRNLRYKLRANIELHQMLGYADQWAKTGDEMSYWRWREQLFPELPSAELLAVNERNAEAAHIRLLLQVGVFDEDGEWWGRNGSLYFFIRDQELREHDFSKVWGTTE